MTTAETLLNWLDLQPGEEVLDVGCGLGRYAAAMAADGVRVTGIDPEAHLLEQARLACPSGVFVPAGLLEFQPPHAFDAIFAHAVLHWIHPPRAASSRLCELLRPGGRLAASYGANSTQASNLVNYYLPDAAQCRSVLLDAGLTDVRIEERPGLLLVYAARPVAG